MNTPIIPQIRSYIDQNGLISQKATLVLGLSGGPDSVFLLHILGLLAKEKGITLIAAHLDHEWRAESAQDRQFCHNLALSQGIPFISKKLGQLGLTIKDNGSQEEIGRKARRFFLQQVATEHNAQAIALAHHADDQQETFFIRLARGAGLSGLTGMSARQGMYIRPLLQIHKADILAYLHEQKIPYLVDSTNESDAYLRNRIRKTLPALKDTDSRFDQNFAQAISRLQETEEYLNMQMLDLYTLICPENRLEITLFLQQHSVMRSRILMHWLCQHKVPFTPSTGLLNEMERFLKNEAPEHGFYEKWKIVKKQGIAGIRYQQF